MADRKRFDIRALPGFGFMAASCFVLLYLPILLVVVYSFNAGDTVSIWKAFPGAGIPPPGTTRPCRRRPCGHC